MHNLVRSRLGLVALVACAHVAGGCDGGLCGSDGVGPGLVYLDKDAWVLPSQRSLFSYTPEERFPYEDGSPFLSCRTLGALSVREDGIGTVDGARDFPLLEELGGFGVGLENDGGHVIDELAGFDDVVRFGGMSGISGLTNHASIRLVSGFNSVEVIEGSLLTTGDVTGFGSVHQIVGELSVENMPGLVGLEDVGAISLIGRLITSVDLPVLERVGGDFIIERTTAPQLHFPALTLIGGQLALNNNSRLDRWLGLAPGAVIEGDFIASFNDPIRNTVFEAWVEEADVSIGGTIRICKNGPEEETQGQTCNDPDLINQP